MANFSKSVVGEPIYVGDTIIVPLISVSFGMGAGAFSGNTGGEGGGIGGRMSPSAVLVIQDGRTRLIDVATNTGINKLLDQLPDLVSNFKNRGKGNLVDPAAREAAAETMEETILDATGAAK